MNFFIGNMSDFMREATRRYGIADLGRDEETQMTLDPLMHMQQGYHAGEGNGDQLLYEVVQQSVEDVVDMK